MSNEIGETPLRERVNGEWSVFEARLFNLITECKVGHSTLRLSRGLPFSGRLRLCESALRAIKNELELIQAEWHLHSDDSTHYPDRT